MKTMLWIEHCMANSDEGKKVINKFQFCCHRVKSWTENDYTFRNSLENMHLFYFMNDEFEYVALSVGEEVYDIGGNHVYFCDFLEVNKPFRGNEYGSELLKYIQVWMSADFIDLVPRNRKIIEKYYLPRGFTKLHGRILRKDFIHNPNKTVKEWMFVD